MLHHDCEKGDAFAINTFAGCLAHLMLLESGVGCGEEREAKATAELGASGPGL